VCLMLGQLVVEDCLAGGLLPVIRVYPGSNTANTPCILHEGICIGVCLMLGQLLVEDCLAEGLLPVIRVYPGTACISNTAKHTLHTARS